MRKKERRYSRYMRMRIAMTQTQNKSLAERRASNI